jgi:hypothetical protein
MSNTVERLDILKSIVKSIIPFIDCETTMEEIQAAFKQELEIKLVKWCEDGWTRSCLLRLGRSFMKDKEQILINEIMRNIKFMTEQQPFKNLCAEHTKDKLKAEQFYIMMMDYITGIKPGIDGFSFSDEAIRTYMDKIIVLWRKEEPRRAIGGKRYFK